MLHRLYIKSAFIRMHGDARYVHPHGATVRVRVNFSYPHGATVRIVVEYPYPHGATVRIRADFYYPHGGTGRIVLKNVSSARWHRADSNEECVIRTVAPCG